MSPELWYDIPLAVTGVPFEEVALGAHPLWQVQLAAHRRFGTDAWIVGFPGALAAAPRSRDDARRRIGDGELEIRTQLAHLDRHAPARRTRNTPGYYDWAIESPVKDLRRDLPGWCEVALADPRTADLADLRAAIAGTGEDGLVTAFVGKLFFDFVAGAREGGSTQAVFDFVDDAAFLAGYHDRYVAWMTGHGRDHPRGHRRPGAVHRERLREPRHREPRARTAGGTCR